MCKPWQGWGCGYRTLQTICSWLVGQNQPGKVPSIPQIQEILVQLEDKDDSFKGSTDYIGSFEVMSQLLINGGELFE